jgi:hypothetical protein
MERIRLFAFDIKNEPEIEKRWIEQNKILKTLKSMNKVNLEFIKKNNMLIIFHSGVQTKIKIKIRKKIIA